MWLPRLSTPRTKEEMNTPTEDHETANEKGWQMWNSSPLCQDTLGLVGGPPSWYLPPELNGSKNGVVELQPQAAMASMFQKEDRVLLNTKSHLTRMQEGATHKELVYGSPNGSATNHQYQLSHGNVWAKKEKA